MRRKERVEGSEEQKGLAMVIRRKGRGKKKRRIKGDAKRMEGKEGRVITGGVGIKGDEREGESEGG